MLNELITLLLVITRVSAHSWLECTNYDPISFDFTTLGDFDPARCTGYPRAFGTQLKAGFGVDTGINNEMSSCKERFPFKESDYDSQVPMATYIAGQTIHMSHPTKNHVADTCTNPFIPSTSFKVKMSSEVGTDTFDVSLKMVGEEHVKGVIDHLGFQRCFNFCANPDKAHCLSAWVLPEVITEGRHSFMWEWEFNPDQFYTNCFDAMIVSSFNDSSTVFANETNSSSGSNFSDVIETPSPTPDQTIPAPETQSPTPDQTIPAPETESPTPLTEDPKLIPDIITSASSSLSDPFKYIRNIFGTVNISRVFNITYTYA